MQRIIGIHAGRSGARTIIEMNADEHAPGLLVRQFRPVRQRHVFVGSTRQDCPKSARAKELLEPQSHVESQIFLSHSVAHRAGILPTVARIDHDDIDAAIVAARSPG
jgi:hypothetical protein